MKVIIVGGGQVGSYLASLLEKRGYGLTIIENRERKFELVSAEVPGARVILGSGSDPKVLESAGIEWADVVAAVTGEDETNLVVSTLAKMEYGIGRVIARVNNPKNAWLFTPQMGVDVALNQADLMARLVEEEVSFGDMVALMQLERGEFTLVEKIVRSGLAVVGRKISELDLPGYSLISAITREGKLIKPDDETVIQAEDKLIAIAHTGQVEELSDYLDRK